MGDLVERPDLLPPHDDRPVPTALVAVDGRLDDIDIAYILTTRDVDKCPPEFLKFLAWNVGVDVWRDAWTDARKRAIIKASPIIKRHKGTKFAVRTAVAAFGLTAQFVEWWQTTPRGTPYTFEVTTFVNSRPDGMTGPLITPELTRDLFDSINAAKPVSRAYDFRIGAILESRLVVGLLGRSLQYARPNGSAAPATTPAACLRLGLAGRALQVVLARMPASAGYAAEPLKYLHEQVGTATAARAIQFVFCRMEAKGS